MLSKATINFTDDSQVSSFGSDDPLLNQDSEEENKSNVLFCHGNAKSHFSGCIRRVENA